MVYVHAYVHVHVKQTKWNIHSIFAVSSSSTFDEKQVMGLAFG